MEYNDIFDSCKRKTYVDLGYNYGLDLENLSSHQLKDCGIRIIELFKILILIALGYKYALLKK